jgi:outer membrane protein assembly factor BamB
MQRYVMWVFTAAAAVTALGSLGLTGVSAAAPAQGARTSASATPHVVTSPGTQLWAARYNHPSVSQSVANSVAVSPDGSTVFVTGYSYDNVRSYDYATVAYNAATGGQLWAERFNGAGNGNDVAQSVAVSPDGSTVFVTGHSDDGALGIDYATVAYNAATGARKWVKTYNGPGNSDDSATAVAVSPSGSAVFVTGSSGSAAATVAYNPVTGARLWVARFSRPGGYASQASALTVSPDGTMVVIAGANIVSSGDYATVAYNASTGARLWAEDYSGPGHGDDEAASVAISPTGDAVYVTGESWGRSQVYDYATVAYDAATGAQQWAARYNGPASIGGQATAVAASPDGSTVFVTGQADAGSGDYATVAYNAATGAQRWVKLYNGPADGPDGALAMAISPTGSTVYVTGDSDGTANTNYATLAYNAATGTQQWVARYNGPGNPFSQANSIAVSPNGTTVFVTGSSGNDYATVAYQG